MDIDRRSAEGTLQARACGCGAPARGQGCRTSDSNEEVRVRHMSVDFNGDSFCVIFWLGNTVRQKHCLALLNSSQFWTEARFGTHTTWAPARGRDFRSFSVGASKTCQAYEAVWRCSASSTSSRPWGLRMRPFGQRPLAWHS